MNLVLNLILNLMVLMIWKEKIWMKEFFKEVSQFLSMSSSRLSQLLNLSMSLMEELVRVSKSKACLSSPFQSLQHQEVKEEPWLEFFKVRLSKSIIKGASSLGMLHLVILARIWR